MNPGIRILVALGAVALFLGLRLLALFRSDHALLGWLAGGAAPGGPRAPAPAPAPRRRR